MVVLLSHKPAQPPRAFDAIELLLGCHERIRRFSALALRLGENHAEPELVSAAAAVHRYFTVALPLHAADEDELVAPALSRGTPNVVVLSALAVMTQQHVEIERLIGDMTPLWLELSGEAELRPARSSELTAGARHLATLFERHLTLEEKVLFPALRRRLSGAELAAMADQIRGRRVQP